MAGWMKAVLAVLLTLGIFAGAAAFTYDQHPMRPNYNMAAEGCAADSGPFSEQRVDCLDHYRTVMDRGDQQDIWAALAAGAVAAGLLWLLLYLFYIRPRRARISGVPQE